MPRRSEHRTPVALRGRVVVEPYDSGGMTQVNPFTGQMLGIVSDSILTGFERAADNTDAHFSYIF